jgi:hypothetical protein
LQGLFGYFGQMRFERAGERQLIPMFYQQVHNSCKNIIKATQLSINEFGNIITSDSLSINKLPILYDVLIVSMYHLCKLINCKSMQKKPASYD